MTARLNGLSLDAMPISAVPSEQSDTATKTTTTRKRKATTTTE